MAIGHDDNTINIVFDYYYYYYYYRVIQHCLELVMRLGSAVPLSKCSTVTVGVDVYDTRCDRVSYDPLTHNGEV